MKYQTTYMDSIRMAKAASNEFSKPSILAFIVITLGLLLLTLLMVQRLDQTPVNTGVGISNLEVGTCPGCDESPYYENIG